MYIDRKLLFNTFSYTFFFSYTYLISPMTMWGRGVCERAH